MTTPPSPNTPPVSVLMKQQLLDWRAEFSACARQNVRNFILSRLVSDYPTVPSDVLRSRANVFENREFASATGRADYFERLTNGLSKFQESHAQTFFKPSQKSVFSTFSPPIPYTGDPNQALHHSPASVQGNVAGYNSISAQGQSSAKAQALFSAQVPVQGQAPSQNPSTYATSAPVQQQHLPPQGGQNTQSYPWSNSILQLVDGHLQLVQCPASQTEATQIKVSSAQKRTGGVASSRKPPTPRAKKKYGRKKGQAVQDSAQHTAGAATHEQPREHFASARQNSGYYPVYDAGTFHDTSLAKYLATLQWQRQHGQALNLSDNTSPQQNNVFPKSHETPQQGLGHVPAQTLGMYVQTDHHMQGIKDRAFPTQQRPLNGTTDAMINGRNNQGMAHVISEQRKSRVLAEELVRQSARAAGVLLTQRQIVELSTDQVRRILDIVAVNKEQPTDNKDINPIPSAQRVPTLSTAFTEQCQGLEQLLQNKTVDSPPVISAPSSIEDAHLLGRGQFLNTNRQYEPTHSKEPRKIGSCNGGVNNEIISQLHEESSVPQAVKCPLYRKDIAMPKTCLVTGADGTSEKKKQASMLSNDLNAQANQMESSYVAQLAGIGNNFSCHVPTVCQPLEAFPCTGKDLSKCDRAVDHRTSENHSTVIIDVTKNEYQIIIKLNEIQRSFRPAMLKMRPIIRRMCDRYSFQRRTLFIKRLGECWNILNISCSIPNDGKTFVSTPPWLSLTLLMKMEWYMYHLLRTAVNALRNHRQREQSRDSTAGGHVSASQVFPIKMGDKLPVVCAESAVTESVEASLRPARSSTANLRLAEQQRQLYSLQIPNLERISKNVNETIQPNGTWQMESRTQQRLKNDQPVSSRVIPQIPLQQPSIQSQHTKREAQLLSSTRITSDFFLETGKATTASDYSAYAQKVSMALQATESQQTVQSVPVIQQKQSEIGAKTEQYRSNTVNRGIAHTTPDIQGVNLSRKTRSLSAFAKKAEAYTEKLENFVTSRIESKQRRRVLDTVLSLGVNQSWRQRQSRGRKRLLDRVDIKNYNGNKTILSKCLFECSTDVGVRHAEKKLKWTDMRRLVEEDCQAVQNCFPKLIVDIEDEFGLPLVKSTFQNTCMQLPRLIIHLDRRYPRKGGTRYGFERPAMGWVGVLVDMKEHFKRSLETGSAEFVGVAACLYAWADAADSVIKKSCA